MVDDGVSATNDVRAQVAVMLREGRGRASMGRDVADNIGPVAEVGVAPLLLRFGEILLGENEEGAEEKTGGVHRDGGAAGGDFVTGLELKEFAEGMVDVGGRAKFLDVADEGGGVVGLIEVLVEQGGVFGAEAGVLIGDGQTATAAARGALLTMGKNGDRGSGGASGFGIHESSFRE